MLVNNASGADTRHLGPSRSDRWLITLSKALDAVAIVFVLVASVSLYPEATWGSRYSIAALTAIILFLFFAEIQGLYRPWRGETFKRQFFRTLSIWGQTFFSLLLLAYAFKSTAIFSRVTVGAWLLTTPSFLLTWRVVGRKISNRFARRESFKHNALVWGAGEHAELLAQTIKKSPWLGLNLTACIRADDLADGSSDTRECPTSKVQCRMESLVQRARQGEFDILYIALPTTARTEIADLIDRLADTTVSVYMVPDYFTTSLFSGRWSNLEGIPIISVYDTPCWGADGCVKRAQDIVLSSCLLLVASVPMLLIAKAVKLSSPGPVLFKQRRYGMDGKEISVWKFRTMRVCEDENEVPQVRKNDPRITPLGSFLRRTSLDELPQFINVLMGDMSIVGPRPHAIAHNELYRSQIKGYMLRHKVRPGITGWAQINGWRGETDTLEKMQRRVEHDLWYMRNWSLWLDIKIILLTAVRGFTGTNAY